MTQGTENLPVPTIGRIVHYRFNQYEADRVNTRRKDAHNKIDWYRAMRPGAIAHMGNEVRTDQLYPAMIVRVWGDTPQSACNLQVFLDGNDVFWATSTNACPPGVVEPGKFCWPTKTETAAGGSGQSERTNA